VWAPRPSRSRRSGVTNRSEMEAVEILPAEACDCGQAVQDATSTGCWRSRPFQLPVSGVCISDVAELPSCTLIGDWGFADGIPSGFSTASTRHAITLSLSHLRHGRLAAAVLQSGDWLFLAEASPLEVCRIQAPSSLARNFPAPSGLPQPTASNSAPISRPAGLAGRQKS